LRTGPDAPFDDAPGIAPTGFATITDLPNVTAGLLTRGYDEAAVRGILGGNMLRLLDTVMAG
ncbi:MAG TPA: membrane dipeptidase, partial [Thermomicrobiales bacterium]|nr:membrane dipeptidase [Thermomicrobiales bacterium]